MKTMKAKMGWVVLACCAAMSSVTWAGAGSSGGGDNVGLESDAAWFTGTNRTIRACFDLASDFGVDAATAKREIEGAFATWQRYIDRKFKFADLSLGIVTSVAADAHCRGDEDLKFYLGTDTQETRLARFKYVNPTAFAFRTDYDRAMGWGKGWIWIAPPASVFPKENFPDWQLTDHGIPGMEKAPYQLRAMLIHEIGHVLGNAHVPGTIMSERISEYLRAGYDWDATRIDQARELAVCWQCGYEWNGSLSIDGQTVSSHDGAIDPARVHEVERRNFEILTGHLPTGPMGVTAKVTAPDYFNGATLELTDFPDPNVYRFPIEFGSDPLSAINDTRVEDSEPIFKRLFPTAGNELGAYLVAKVQGDIRYGTITTAAGEKLTLIMERNLPVPEPLVIAPVGSAGGIANIRADYRLKMIYRGQVRPLFEAMWLEMSSSSFGQVHPIQTEPAPTPTSAPKLTPSPLPLATGRR
jgi:hypothetical protein